MERRLVAILATDVVGYSRFMGKDETGTLERLKFLRRELVQPRITERKGRIVKLMGDGLLAEFPSVVEAVQCAIDIQQSMIEHEADLPDERRIRLRIGVNLGDIIVEGSDIYGDGVNVASRLEGLASPGNICVSGTVFDHVKGKVGLDFEDLGEQQVKNIDDPVRVYRIALGSGADTSEAAGTFSSGAPVLELPDKPSIAVLPFTNMSGDPDQEYFSDGITEDIITELSRFQDLLVIARNSSFAYKGRSVNVTEIGCELGVHYVVEGSVRKAGNRVRVTAQLIEAKSGSHLWAERYDRDLEDIFAVQDELTQAIVTVLPIQLQSSILEKIRAKPTENLSAYEYLLRGRWLWHGDVTNARDALSMFERAVALDPNCGRAYAIAAFVYAHGQFSLGIDFNEAARNARFNAQKALSVDDNDAFIHSAAALAFMICGDHDLGETHADRALKLNANEAWVTYACGLVFTYAGRLEEGLEWLQRAIRYDPRVADNWHESLIECHYMRHDYKAALEAFRGWQNIPFYMYDICAACYAQLGDTENAQRMYETYRRLAPEGHDSEKDHHAHLRMMKRQVDRDHWIEGYVKAGFKT
jgi:adenylate cyclase